MADGIMNRKMTECWLRFCRKLTAISFIYLVLLGNFWFVLLFIGVSDHPLLSQAFFVGMFGAGVSGFGLLIGRLFAMRSQIVELD